MASLKKRRVKTIETSEDEDTEILGSAKLDSIQEMPSISIDETDIEREMKILSFLFANQPYGDLEYFSQHFLCWILFKTALAKCLTTSKEGKDIFQVFLEMEEEFMKFLCFWRTEDPWPLPEQLASAQQKIFKLKTLIQEWEQLLFKNFEPVFIEGKGIGVLTKRKMPVSALNLLPGYNSIVPESLFNALKFLHYPSLIAPNIVLYGPLSLVNHSCDSQVFLKPEGPLTRTSIKPPNAKVTFPKGKEVVINYGDSHGIKNCICASCNPPHY
jgi:hypothetical protein